MNSNFTFSNCTFLGVGGRTITQTVMTDPHSIDHDVGYQEKLKLSIRAWPVNMVLLGRKTMKEEV